MPLSPFDDEEKLLFWIDSSNDPLGNRAALTGLALLASVYDFLYP